MKSILKHFHFRGTIMKLNNEEIEHLVYDQTADDPVEVESISEFHEEQDHLDYLSDVNLMSNVTGETAGGLRYRGSS